jgi:hypothetical protein
LLRDARTVFSSIVVAFSIIVVYMLHVFAVVVRLILVVKLRNAEGPVTFTHLKGRLRELVLVSVSVVVLVLVLVSVLVLMVVVVVMALMMVVVVMMMVVIALVMVVAVVVAVVV